MSNDNLPEPKYYVHQFGEACGYTADQVRQAQQEAVGKLGIAFEKLLCAKLGRDWAPSGFSVETLLAELQPVAQRDAVTASAATLPAAWTDRHTRCVRFALFLAGEIGRKKINDLAQQKARGVDDDGAINLLIADLADMDAARVMLTELLP